MMANEMTMLKKLHSILGEKQFVNCILEVGKANINAFEKAVKIGKLSHFQYLASCDGIRSVYNNKETAKLRYRLLYHLLAQCKNDEMIDVVFKEFDFDETEICTLINFKYPKPTKKFDQYNAYEYH